MSDDIVTRLRNDAENHDWETLCLMDSAADEIDRLRADRHRWELAARMAYHYPTHNIHVGPLSCEQCADAFKAYKEALGTTDVG